MDGDVHNHESFGSKLDGQDLEGVRNEKTGPCERVEDTEEPDERDLNVTGGLWTDSM